MIFLLLVLTSCGSNDYSVKLTWNVPTTNTDGTPLTDLAGYELYVGISSNNYTRTITIPVEDKLLSCNPYDYNIKTKTEVKCRYTVTGLQPGDYYFVIRAYNMSGEKSVLSNEVKKTAARGI